MNSSHSSTSTSTIADTGANVARQVGDHPWVVLGARVGYGVNGVLHLILGWLAFQLGTGQSRSDVEQSGALSHLAATPLGGALLWVAVIGLSALAIWQFTEACVVREWSDRGKALGKGVAYVALVFTAMSILRGASTDSGKQTADATAGLMQMPFGRILVGLVGVALLGIAGYHVYKGYKQKFLQDLTEHPGTAAVWAGRVGYIAKGIALGGVGFLFIAAGLQNYAKKNTGLDGALHSMLTLPWGTWLVAMIGLGFIAFGVYSFFRARYAKV